MTSPLIKKAAIKRWYEGLAQASADVSDFTFMNYGFVDPKMQPIVLEDRDQPHRFAAQLYHHLCGEASLDGKALLEVGCGRGGGASFVMRTYAPRSMMAIDISPAAVDLCRQVHDVPGLSFEVGDAERLSFDSASFDAVINVESSHGYGAMRYFISGVTNVLRSGGLFLFADLRPTGEINALRDQLTEHGLQIVRERDITTNVVAALNDGRETDYRLALGDQVVEEAFRAEYEKFAGKKNTVNHRMLCDGEMTYLSIVLEKP